MVLRQDERQFLIYDPNTVHYVFKAVEAAMIAAGAAWLQRVAVNSPSSMRDNMGLIGRSVEKFAEARMEIQAGLAPNDVDDQMVRAQRMWDIVQRWNQKHGSVDPEAVTAILDQFAGALVYMEERTMETGTNHPRWNSGLVSSTPCESCGR